MKQLITLFTAITLTGAVYAAQDPEQARTEPSSEQKESVLTPGAKLIAGDPQKNEFYIVDNEHPLPKTGVYQPPKKEAPKLAPAGETNPVDAAKNNNQDISQIKSALNKVDNTGKDKAEVDTEKAKPVATDSKSKKTVLKSKQHSINRYVASRGNLGSVKHSSHKLALKKSAASSRVAMHTGRNGLHPIGFTRIKVALHQTNHKVVHKKVVTKVNMALHQTQHKQKIIHS